MTSYLLRWILAAAVSSYAAVVVARHTTPVDAALPFLVIVVTAIAAASHPAIQLAVPLLLVGEIVLPDERQRLFWFGLVIGVSFAAATLRIRDRWQAVFIAISAIVVLRWIPLDEVLVGRELILIAIGAAVVVVLGSTPIAVAIAVTTALFTPAIPLRTLAVPLGVLAIAAFARAVGSSRIRMPATAAAAVAIPLMFFAWSGAFARATPIMLRGGPPVVERIPVRIALGPGEYAEIDIPSNARGLILSGANVPRLEAGTQVGVIEPAGIEIRIGDIADWGFLRREHYYNSENPLPRRPGGLIRGYGQTAWIDASGRIAVPPGRVTVRADPGLPRGASLQIDAIELTR